MFCVWISAKLPEESSVYFEIQTIDLFLKILKRCHFLQMLVGEIIFINHLQILSFQLGICPW